MSTLPVSFYDFPLSDVNNYTYSLGSNLYDNRKISNIDAVFEITMDYEACGAEYGSMFFARKGNKLIYITQTSNVSEAGCFAYSEEIIFPDDKTGAKEKIIIKILHEEYDEEIEDYKTTEKKEKVIIFNKDKFIEKK